jgi:hypothetical protein
VYVSYKPGAGADTLYALSANDGAVRRCARWW